MTPNTTESAEWNGPLLSWLINILVWLTAGMSPLTALGAMAALWWTVERVRTERAKQRQLAGFEARIATAGHPLRRSTDRPQVDTNTGGLA